MAPSYTINSGSKLLIVSSLLASSVAFTANATTTKTKNLPIGSGEVSSDVAEKLFINMHKDMQKNEIEQLNKKMATLEQSHQQQKELIARRLAELESTVSTQPPIKKKHKLKSIETARSPVKKSNKPTFMPKVSSLKIKRNPNSSLNIINVDPVVSYKTAQINNATIKSLTNNSRSTTASEQEIEQVTPTSVESSKPLVDDKGELLAIQPGSVTLNHEFSPIVTKPKFKAKVSKLKIKPQKVTSKQLTSPKPFLPKQQPKTDIIEVVTPVIVVKVPSEEQPIKNSISSQSSEPMPNTMASELYLKALQAFSVEQTDTAIRDLQQYINAYPNEALIAKAHYWLGESYLQKEPANYAAARFEFIEVIDRYDNHPNNDKQLKALYRLSQLSKINNYDDELKLYTQMLQNRYPTAEETQQALELLD